MKNIVISADGDRKVFSVPDAVADNLTKVFPNQRSKLVENLGWIEFNSKLPEPYADCPIFNF